jgi:hypothetical protein
MKRAETMRPVHCNKIKPRRAQRVCMVTYTGGRLKDIGPVPMGGARLSREKMGHGGTTDVITDHGHALCARDHGLASQGSVVTSM